LSTPAFSVDAVFDALVAQPLRTMGDGRCILFVGARRSDNDGGAASAVAQAALTNAVYAIDLDLRRNAMAKSLSQADALGPAIDGRLNGVSFYNVRKDLTQIEEAQPAFRYHRVGRTRVFAGLFDARAIPQGARVVVSSSPAYWNAARAGGATVVLDAPPLERSHLALRVARHMDGVVLVVGPEAGAAPAAMAAKEALIGAGANLIGLVYSGASAPMMTIERLLG
jgi:hypothetical protein